MLNVVEHLKLVEFIFGQMHKCFELFIEGKKRDEKNQKQNTEYHLRGNVCRIKNVLFSCATHSIYCSLFIVDVHSNIGNVISFWHNIQIQMGPQELNAFRLCNEQWMNDWERKAQTSNTKYHMPCAIYVCNAQCSRRFRWSNSMMRSFIQSFSKSFDMWSGWKEIFITTTESIKKCCKQDSWHVLFPIFSH